MVPVTLYPFTPTVHVRQPLAIGLTPEATVSGEMPPVGEIDEVIR
jgi:hypothetical protein